MQIKLLQPAIDEWTVIWLIHRFLLQPTVIMRIVYLDVDERGSFELKVKISSKQKIGFHCCLHCKFPLNFSMMERRFSLRLQKTSEGVQHLASRFKSELIKDHLGQPLVLSSNTSIQESSIKDTDSVADS